jgi:hypothetical protein
VAWVSGARTDGFSSWEVRAFTWSSLGWSIGALVVTMRLARRRIGIGSLQAFVGPLACALAGPIVYYAIRQPGYAHPIATFFATLLVERWDASYDQPRSVRTWLVLGALLGACTLVRPQLGLWAILLVAAAVDDLRARRNPRVVLGWLAGAGAAFVVVLPQLAAWKVLYGEWYVVPQGAGFMRWDAPCWSEVLFSSRNGLLPWSPAYALFALGFAALARRQPRLIGLLALGVVLQVVANGAAWDWWGGGSFGGRRFDSTFVAFALGATALVAWLARAVQRSRGGNMQLRGFTGGAIAAVGALLVVVLVVANLELVAQTSTTNARITGGEPASRAWRERCDVLTGPIAAAMSALANLPARVAFAWRHDTSWDAYDRLVGVHVLGETYPGLNSYPDQRVATLSAPTFDADGHTRVFVGLNRRGGVDVRIPISAPATITWNGRSVDAHFQTADLVRGTNELAIGLPPGERVGAIRIEAIDP